MYHVDLTIPKNWACTKRSGTNGSICAIRIIWVELAKSRITPRNAK